VNTVGTDPGEDSNRERSFGAGEISQGGELTARFAEENREIPLIVGSWRSCGELTHSAAGRIKPIAYRHSAFDEVRRRLVEIASRDFPSYSEPSISTGTGGARSREIGVRRSGFSIAKENLHRGFAIREIPKVTWQCGTTEI
jgi:hypothetical protein